VLEWEEAAVARLRDLPPELRAQMPDIQNEAGRRGAQRVARLVESLELSGRDVEATALREELARSPLGNYLGDARPD
jgi:hypothetical protein